MVKESSRNIVLTGCTRGLGRALAESFAAAGHVVIGCGRNEKDIHAMRKQFGAPHDFEALDVTHDAGVQAWARRTLARCGSPDLLINNAALMNRPAKSWLVPADEFNHVIDVNIKGMMNVLRHFVPAMVARGSGVIVNLSSGWGRSTAPDVAPYCATKFAVEGLTRALAQELPEGMAAIPLNPGVIDTEMLRSCFGAGAASYPNPKTWAETAAPVILKLGGADNGKSRSVPG